MMRVLFFTIYSNISSVNSSFTGKKYNGPGALKKLHNQSEHGFSVLTSNPVPSLISLSKMNK